MKHPTSARCPICQFALVAVATGYLCGEHGPVQTGSFEAEVAPVAATDAYNPHGEEPEPIAVPLPMRPVPAKVDGAGFDLTLQDGWDWDSDDADPPTSA
jgi:hypothetical protein